MKTISSALKNHISGEVTTTATCWKLTQQSGTVLGFTDNDKDLVVDSVTYVASTSFTPSKVISKSDLDKDGLMVQGVIDSTTITEADILAGKFDFSEVEIFKVNYLDLTQGKLTLRRGWLGTVSFSKNSFIAEINGLTDRLDKTIAEFYSPACRAKLGDGKCQVNMAPFTKTGTITAVDSRIKFNDTSRNETAGYFSAGKFTFTSGANDGLSVEVKEFQNGVFTLTLPMPYDISVGDSYVAEAGCDKSFATCKTRFSNAINFRGEPHIPGIDRAMQTAGTKTKW